MKRTLLLAVPAMMALILFTSCKKENKLTPEQEKVRVDLLFAPQGSESVVAEQPDYLTKASGSEHGNSLFDEEVKTLQLFAFNANGTLDAYTLSSGSPLALKSGTTPTIFSLSVSKGQKRIYAVANSHNIAAFKSVTTQAELEAMITSISNENTRDFFMTGMVNLNIEGNTTAHIQLERMISRVELHSVRTNFSGGYDGMALEEVKAYLINVNSQAVLGSGVAAGNMLNRNQLVAGDLTSLTMPDMIYSPIADITETPSSTVHYFYCYPNSDNSAKTMLVIEGKLNGNLCYYPIEICDDIQNGYSLSRNTTFVLTDVTFSRMGSDSPNVPVEVGTLSLTLTVKDWTTRTYTSITI